MKKTLALALALIMTLSMFSGCNTNETSEDPGNTEDTGNTVIPSGPMELVVGCVADIGSMYPGGTSTSGVKTKRVLVYEQLLWQDYNNDLQPILAKSYESKGDGRYEIEIFDYIYDSEGNHMTASDVIFSIDLYIKDGKNSATYASLDEYKATGEYTLELVFAPEEVGQFMAFVTNIPCVTEAAWNSSDNEMATYPIGTGGYVLVPEQSVIGSNYVFVKRDDYWQTDEQYICDRNTHNLDKVTVKIITDTSTLAIALETGEIDFATDIDPADRALFSDTSGNAAKGYIMLEGTNNAFVNLMFNCGPDSPCADINLRKAISHAIDAAACSFSAHGVFGKVCFAATNPGLGDSGEEMGNGDYFTYDVSYAKELLEQSSYNGETIQILVNPVQSVSKCAPLIQQYCAEIGVKVELLEYDMAQYRSLQTEETGTVYDIELLGATAGDDFVVRSLKYLNPKTYSNGLNRLFIDDPDLQKLYEAAAKVETNSPKTVKALLDYVEENCYIYGIYYSPKYFFGKDFITYGKAVVYDDAVVNAFVINK